jgi:hypothetical protein
MAKQFDALKEYIEHDRRDAMAGAFLAFAAMMAEDYGVNKEVALKALALAYDMNSHPQSEGVKR